MDFKNTKLIVIILLSIAVILDLLGPIVFAIVVTYLTKKIFDYLNKIINNRALSAFLVTFGVLVVIAFPVAVIAQSIVANASAIAGFSSDIILKITTLTKGVGSGTAGTLTGMFEQKVISALSGFIVEVPKVMLDLFVMLILVYYFLKDGPKIHDYVHGLAKEKKDKEILKQLEGLLEGVIVGNILAAIAIGFVSYLLFLVLGIKFAAILAIGVGFAALVPVIGVWIVYVPLIAYYGLIGNYPAAAAIGTAFVFAQVLEIYLGPKLSSHMTNIHPAILLLGFIGGPLLFGAKGIILGPLILGAAKIILDSYRK